MYQFLTKKRAISVLTVALVVFGALALVINLSHSARANGIQQVIVIDDEDHNENEQARPVLFVSSPQHNSVVTSNTVNYSARFSWINCGNRPTVASIKVYEKISGGKIANANNIGDWNLLDQKSLNRDKTCHGCNDRQLTSVGLSGTFQLASLANCGSTTTLWTSGDSRGSWRGALLYDFTWLNREACPVPTPTPTPVPTPTPTPVPTPTPTPVPTPTPTPVPTPTPTPVPTPTPTPTPTPVPTPTPTPVPTPTPTPTPTPVPTPTPCPSTPTPTPTATPCSNCSGTTTIVTENNVVVVTDSDDDEDDDTIELYKTDDHETVKPGETLTYRIVIRNNKDHDLTNVKVQDTLPIYLTPLSTQPAASADAKSRKITWDDQTISANSEVTYSLKVRVDQSAPNGFLLQNVAIINGDGIRASASDSTLIQGYVPQIAGATTTISAPQAVPVSAATGVPFDAVSTILSLSGTVATAGTLIAKRFI